MVSGCSSTYKRAGSVEDYGLAGDGGDGDERDTLAEADGLSDGGARS
jgi:hypothetical protein